MTSFSSQRRILASEREQTGGRQGERLIIHLGGYYKVSGEKWHLDQGDGGDEAKWMDSRSI